MKIPEHERGYQDGMRAAITWLHAEAKRMNDPHATQILDCAAHGVGVELANWRQGRGARAAALAADTGSGG